MDPLTKYEAALLKLLDASNEAHAAGVAAAKLLEDMPRTTEDIEGALLALRDADLEQAEHQRRYPYSPERYEADDEMREDWIRILDLRDKAIDRLRGLANAIALRRTQTRAA